jgi:S-formylglutathione hydrolase FrmB
VSSVSPKGGRGADDGRVSSRPVPLRRLYVGVLYPSNTTVNGAITDGKMRYGGVDIRNMWGMPQLGRWKWHDPYVLADLLADNDTRLWIFSPETVTASHPAALIGYADQAQGTNRSFDVPRGQWSQRALRFSGRGDHGWSSWAPQLATMSGNLTASIK